jgi:hypothetical protein
MPEEPTKSMDYASMITAVISGITELVKLYNTIKTNAKQDHELTAEEEAAFDKKISDTLAQAHWQL